MHTKVNAAIDTGLFFLKLTLYPCRAKMILGMFVPNGKKSGASQSGQTASSGVDHTVGGWVYIGCVKGFRTIRICTET